MPSLYFRKLTAALLSLCLLCMLFLPLAAAVPNQLSEVPFSSCLPSTLTSGSEVTFLNGWEPVKGTLSSSAPQFSYTATLNYCKNSKFTNASSEGGSWRKNGRFELLTQECGVAVGAMYTATATGLVDLSITTLKAVRQLMTGADAQATVNVGGTTYFEYYSTADGVTRYYSTIGGYSGNSPAGGWYRYNASTGRMEATGVNGTMAMAYPTAAFLYDIAITLNGNIIWPSYGSLFHYEGSVVSYKNNEASEDFLAALEKAEPLPTGLYLEQGDQLAFVATCGHASNNYLIMEPVVSYTATFEAVDVQAGISIDDKFAIDYYLQADAAATEAGVLLGDESLSGTLTDDGRYRVRVGGIAAKELGDKITVTPFQTISGIRVKSAPVTVSPAELLMQYVKADAQDATSALAIAILNYGAAAQTYFGCDGQPLMNAALSEEQRSVTYQNDYESILAATSVTGFPVLPESMTLILEDAVAFDLYVRAENAGAYRAQISSDVGFEERYTVTMQPSTSEGLVYDAVFYGILPTNWNTPYYFRVIDEKGNAVSPIIRYSVASYIVRMMDAEMKAAEETDTDTEPRSTPLLESMLALYEAALTYTRSNKSA